MRLSNRLKCIADEVTPCRCVCDIGTDHAHIPIYLVKKNIARRAIASDIKKGPCEAAKNNVISAGLSDKIEIRMGNGFEKIGQNECDTAIIAGLGGNITISIFDADSEKVKNINRIILQPQNAHERVRKYLAENGFETENEKLVFEDGKFYTVMVIHYSGKPLKTDRLNYYIGQKLIENKDVLLEKFLDKEITRLERILAKTENEEYSWLLKEYAKLKERILWETK